jgi:phage terminase small subunit
MTPQKTPKLPTCPAGLTPESKRLWTAIVGEYALEQHHLAILGRALEQNDRALAARKIIAKEGVTKDDRFGQTKPHPCIDVERNAAMAFQRLLRELGLDIELPETRGPRRPGTRQ